MYRQSSMGIPKATDAVVSVSAHFRNASSSWVVAFALLLDPVAGAFDDCSLAHRLS